MTITDDICEVIKKHKKRKHKKKDDAWSLTQRDRIEYLMHCDRLDRYYGSTSYIFQIPYEIIKLCVIIYVIGLLTYMAIPKMMEPLIALLRLIDFIPKVIFIGFVVGFGIDMINSYSRRKKYKELNKRFGMGE